MDTREKGRWGEQRAREYLMARGYTQIDRNVHLRYGEIDGIFRAPDGTVVFLEVKSARGSGCGNPLFWVNGTKQKKLARLARHYIVKNNLVGQPARFDVIAVTREGCEHIRNAFLV